MVCRLHNNSPASETDLIPVPVLPALMQDIVGTTNKWGNEGKCGRIDPFTEVYEVNLFPTPGRFRG